MAVRKEKAVQFQPSTVQRFLPCLGMGLGAGLALGTSLGLASAVQAQSITPAADGTGSVVLQVGDRFSITGGSLSGNGENLFHSFERFGLDLDQTANFAATPEIRNILGRVTGGEASYINGLVQVGNGTANLVLINPAGILTGVNSRINVPGSFTATTADWLGFDGQWLNVLEAGAFATQDAPLNGLGFSANAPGAIVTEGQIQVGAGQQLRLVGGTVLNTGELVAPGGEVTLLSVLGQQTTSFGTDGSISLGTSLPGEAPLLTLQSVPELVAGRSVNQATQVMFNAAGEVELLGQVVPAEPGVAIASGKLDVSAERGGRVEVLGDRVALLSAEVNATGIQGGGEVLIGGDYQGKGSVPNARFTEIDSASRIQADALATGEGGRVIAWADDTTRFAGAISARGGSEGGEGGFVEVSGKQQLVFRGQADVTAPQGLAGTLLLDPERIRIVNGNGGANDAALGGGGIFRSEGGAATFTISETALEALSGNVVLEATREIEIEDLTTDGQLDLNNVSSITFDVRDQGLSNFTMVDRTNAIVTQGGDVTIDVAGEIFVGRIITNGGDITLNADFGIDLSENLSLQSGGGDISLEGTADGTIFSSGSLSLIAGTGDISINGTIGRSVGSETVADITMLGNNIDLGRFANRSINAEGSILISGQGEVSTGPSQSLRGGQGITVLGDSIVLNGARLESSNQGVTVDATNALTVNNGSTLSGATTASAEGNSLEGIGRFSRLRLEGQTLLVEVDGDIDLAGLALQGQDGTVRSLTGSLLGDTATVEAAALTNDLTLEAAQNITLTDSDIQVGRDLTLQATGTVSLTDSEDPMTLVAGRDLTVQGNSALAIDAFRDPASLLEAGRDLRLRSDGPIQVNAVLASGTGGAGNLIVERISDGNPASFSSSTPSFATLLRANGDVSFGDYEGASLKIVATGNINGGNIDIVGANPSLTGPDPDLLLLQNQEALILQAGADSPGGTVNLPPNQAIGGTNAVASPTPGAAGSITVGNISDVEGPVRLNASGAIITGDIETSESFGGVSPQSPILITSTGGSVTTGDLLAERSDIQVSAAGNLTVQTTSNGGLDSGLVRTTLTSTAGGVQFDTIDAGGDGLYIEAATFVRGIGSRTDVGISDDLVNDPGLIDYLVAQGFDRTAVEAANVTINASTSEPRFSIVMRPAGLNVDGLTAPVFIRYGDRNQTLVDRNYTIEGNPSRVLIEGDSQQAFRLGPAFDGQPIYEPANPADSLASYDPVTNNFDFRIAEGRQLDYGTDEFPTAASGLAAGIIVGEGTNGAFYASLQDQSFDPSATVGTGTGTGTGTGPGTGTGTTGTGTTGTGTSTNPAIASRSATSAQRRSGSSDEVCEDLSSVSEGAVAPPILSEETEAVEPLIESLKPFQNDPCAPVSNAAVEPTTLLRSITAPALPEDAVPPEFSDVPSPSSGLTPGIAEASRSDSPAAALSDGTGSEANGIGSGELELIEER